MTPLPLCAAAAALALATPVLAQSPDLPPGCTITGETRVISVLVCPPDLSAQDLSQAGRAACGSRSPCGAWIWSEASLAPAAAPENHDGLTEAQVTSAEAVWIAETSLLVTIGTDR